MKETLMASVAATIKTHRQPKTERPEPEHLVLAGADREAFLDAVRNPPEPAAKLVAALRRHRAMLG
jgi:uncharacterized protein (DUF1778 family)